MKKNTVALLISIICFITASAADNGKDMFSAFNSFGKDIESVYIGKAMIKQSIDPKASPETVELISQIDYIIIYSSKNRRGAKKIYSLGKEILDNSDMELQLSSNEEANLSFYTRPYPDDSVYFSQIVMLMNEGNNASLINIGGKIDLSVLDYINIDNLM